MKYDWTHGEAWGKGTAAVVGGALVFVLSIMATGTALPLAGVPVTWAVALSLAVCAPAWALAAGWALLARNGLTAWARVVGASVLLAAVTAAAKFL